MSQLQTQQVMEVNRNYLRNWSEGYLFASGVLLLILGLVMMTLAIVLDNLVQTRINDSWLGLIVIAWIILFIAQRCMALARGTRRRRVIWEEEHYV